MQEPHNNNRYLAFAGVALALYIMAMAMAMASMIIGQ